MLSGLAACECGAFSSMLALVAPICLGNRSARARRWTSTPTSSSPHDGVLKIPSADKLTCLGSTRRTVFLAWAGGGGVGATPSPPLHLPGALGKHPSGTARPSCRFSGEFLALIRVLAWCGILCVEPAYFCADEGEGGSAQSWVFVVTWVVPFNGVLNMLRQLP